MDSQLKTRNLVRGIAFTVAAVSAYMMISSWVSESRQYRQELEDKERKSKQIEKGEVTRLFIYPVKSCRGIEVERAELERIGFKHDRRWMIVDENGTFLSQRRCALMSQIYVKLLQYEDGPIVLELSCPSVPHTVRVPVDTSAEKLRTDPVRVWDDILEQEVYDQGEVAARWLARALLMSGVRLVYMGDKCRRPVSEKHRAYEDDVTSFNDGYPYLLVSEDSLDDLNRRMKIDLPLDRFRPNIVVKGLKPFEEDTLCGIQIGEQQYFHIVKPCSRCKITTIDQATGESPSSLDVEPMLTLRTFRKKGDDVFFGQNLIWAPEQAKSNPPMLATNSKTILFKR